MEHIIGQQREILQDELDGVLRIPFNEIFVDWSSKLGEGGFSIIFSGQWNGQQVAIKKLKFYVTKDELLKEAKVLSSLKSDYIVPFLGVTADATNDILVVLALADGSLDKFLQEKGALCKRESIQIALDIAQGISYLHSVNTWHRDLKCANVLLFQGPVRAKIADFGAARILTQKSMATTRVGTNGFIAPEVLHDRPYDSKIDVYSFGVVLYHMLTNKGLPVLFEDDKHMIDKIRENVMDFQMLELIIECCRKLPADRPTIDECIHRLNNMQDNESNANLRLLDYLGTTCAQELSSTDMINDKAPPEARASGREAARQHRRPITLGGGLSADQSIFDENASWESYLNPAHPKDFKIFIPY